MCIAVDAILNGTPLTGQGSYWDPGIATNDNEVQCDLPQVDGGVLEADIGVSDIFASTCTPLPNGMPNDVRDSLGPIQTMAFVVPKASQQRAISATAADFVYGFGADSGVPPWTNPTLYFPLLAYSSSATRGIIAAGINVHPKSGKGPTPATAPL